MPQHFPQLREVGGTNLSADGHQNHLFFISRGEWSYSSAFSSASRGDGSHLIGRWPPKSTFFKILRVNRFIAQRFPQLREGMGAIGSGDGHQNLDFDSHGFLITICKK